MNNPRPWSESLHEPSGTPLGAVSTSVRDSQAAIERLTKDMRRNGTHIVGDTPDHPSGSSLVSFGGDTGESGSPSPSYPEGTTEAGE